MGGKSSAPAAPDYSAIAQSDTQAAQLAYQTSQNQLDWSQQQYNQEEPYIQNYLQSQTDNANAVTASAQQQQATYNSTYLPIEQQFANQASTWNSADRQAQNQGQAEADVASQFDAARATSQSQLESYGVDPSQTRFSALDLGTRISQAAATASAGTQSALNTQATGLALEGEAINTGKGYASNIANSYNTATNAGGAGINAATSAASQYGSVMNGTAGFMNAGTNANNGATSAMSTGYNDSMAQTSMNNSNAAAPYNIGASLIGSALGAASMF